MDAVWALVRMVLFGVVALLDVVMLDQVVAPRATYAISCPTEDATRSRIGTPGCVWWPWQGTNPTGGYPLVNLPGIHD